MVWLDLIRGWMFWAIVAALLTLMSHVALAADERQIRRDCTWDALRYCKSAIAAATEQASRTPIINCMVANRDKLQAKCSRHLY